MINTAFPGGVGRWEVRRSQFRQGGLPHELLVLSDLSRPLREEERQAFQRLIRVIGHEMNNSLAPIKSIAGSLSTIIDRDPPPSDWREDVTRGLAVIASRSESLSRFMSAYARLAKLPPPKLVPLDVGTFVDRVVTLEKAHQIRVQPGPPPRRPGGRRPARTADDQPHSQCRRRRARDRWRGDGRLGPPARLRLRRRWSCGSKTKGPACRIPAICSCRSSPPSREAQGSAWSSAARSPKRTAAACCCEPHRPRRLPCHPPHAAADAGRSSQRDPGHRLRVLPHSPNSRRSPHFPHPLAPLARRHAPPRTPNPP